MPQFKKDASVVLQKHSQVFAIFNNSTGPQHN